jgi:hypothetical protein
MAHSIHALVFNARVAGYCGHRHLPQQQQRHRLKRRGKILGKSLPLWIHPVHFPVTRSLPMRYAAMVLAAMLKPIEMPPNSLFHVIVTANR